MKNNRINSSITVILTLLVSIFIVAGCNNSKNIPPDASATNDSAQTETKQDSSSGLKKPMSYGIISITSGKGFSVYGSAQVKANTRQVRAEIDTDDLDKIQIGNKVSLINRNKGIFFQGMVTGLPDEQSLEGQDICYIDILLDDTPPEASQPETPTEPPDQTPNQNSQDSSEEIIMENVSVSAMGGLPAVDAEVEVQIHLPTDDNLIYIENDCIFEGRDGKKYVWASEKRIDQVQADDLILVEIIPGETDGKVTRIISGLKDGGSILVAVN